MTAVPNHITVLVRPDGRIAGVSASVHGVLGYTPAEMEDRSVYSIVHDEDRQLLQQLLEIPDAYPTGMLRMAHGNGTWRVFEVSSSDLRNRSNRQAITLICRDITLLRQQEEQRLASQRMEAIGRFAGGVAHDFNNALTVIRGQADLLLEDGKLEIDQQHTVHSILKAAEHAATLTRQLLAFSRQQILQPRVLNLNEVVRNVEKMLQHVLNADIELRIDLADELANTQADPGQIEQVLLNLAGNARDAMPDGGVLSITTENVEIDPAYAQSFPYRVTPGPYVRITVSDTGAGMDEETRDHIFEPFYTTKEDGRGTGLGLSTAYGIIKQSGGYIWVDSEPGKGSTFRIYLPVAEGDVEAPQPLPYITPRAGAETILLVEDNPDVRSLLRSVLLKRGYSVLEAENGREAMEVVEGYSRPVDLLVTDIVMPEMNGREIASLIARKYPDIRVLLISGYTEEAAQRPGILDPGTPFLEKPFSVDEFMNKVQEVLAH